MFRLSSYLALALAGFLVSTSNAWADDEKWSVSEVAGAANVVAPMAQPHAIRKGEMLLPGATLTTGADGKVVFTDGKTTVTVSGNSRLTMPADPSDAMTRFAQDMGSVFFKVEKRPMQHFEVETPLVAAVVKGTQFTVTAGTAEHVVDVTEGLVEVVAMNGGQKEMVPAGRSARVRTDAPTKLKLAGDPPGSGKILHAIGAEPVDYAMATDGLVSTTQSAVTTHTDGGSSGSNEASSAAGNQVALVDGAAGVVGGVVADVGVGAGNAGNGGGVGVGVDAGLGAGGGGGVGLGVEVGAGGTGGGAGAGVSAGVEAGSGGVGIGIGVGLTGGTPPGQGGTPPGQSSGSTGVGVGVGVGVGSGGGGVGIGIGLTGGTPPGQGGTPPGQAKGNGPGGGG